MSQILKFLIVLPPNMDVKGSRIIKTQKSVVVRPDNNWYEVRAQKHTGSSIVCIGVRVLCDFS